MSKQISQQVGALFRACLTPLGCFARTRRLLRIPIGIRGVATSRYHPSLRQGHRKSEELPEIVYTFTLALPKISLIFQKIMIVASPNAAYPQRQLRRTGITRKR